MLSCVGQLKALPPPPSLVQLPHTGRNKKTHLSVALSMSPLCVAVFQGTWSVFSHNEINSPANCATASSNSSREGLQDRADKADQSRHIVRSVSLIYLCALCCYIELYNPVFPLRLLCRKWTTAAEVQYWCAISPFSWKCPWGPFKVFCVLCWARSFLTVTSLSL